MKKILFATLMLLATGIVSQARSTANLEPDSRTIAAFARDFAGASNAVWQQSADFSKVTFEMNGTVLFAYYSPAGSLIAASRNILSSQLPLTLQTSLKKDYSNYWISDLFELSTDAGTEYYVTLENADEKKIMRAENYSWTYYSNSSK